MKAMILAAGQGTRLRPLTNHTPKPMLPIAGKPLLEYTIELLQRHQVKDVVINLHHCPEEITNHFGDGGKWGLHITYSREPKLLGTAGAVKKMESFFDDTFLVIYGDNLSNCNISRLADFHRARKGIGTIAIHRRENPSASGMVKLGKDARIGEFVEKPAHEQVSSNLVSAGILVLEPRVLECIPEGQMYDFGSHLFPQLLERGERLYGYLMSEDLLWIDTPEDYQYVQDYVSEGRFNLQ